MSWLKYTRGTIHPHSFFIPMKAHFEFSAELTEMPLADVAIAMQEKKLWWAWHEQKLKSLGLDALRRCSTQDGARTHFKKLQKYIDQTISGSKKILRMNLEKCTNKEIVGLYEEIYKISGPFQAFLNVDIDAIDVVFEKFFKDKIRKEIKGKVSEEKFGEICKKLSLPSHQSYVGKEEIDIIKAALKKRSGKSDIKKLRDKYWWISLGWENMEPYDEKYFIKKISAYKKDKKINEKLKHFQNHAGDIRKDRQKIIKQYHLSEDITYWLDIVDKYALFHDARKEAQMISTYVTQVILVEIARRYRLNPRDLEWLWHHEMAEILDGKPMDKNIIKKRKAMTFIGITRKGSVWLEGDAAMKEKEKYFPENQKKVNEIKGVVANKGRVRACVKVCAGYRDALEKIKKGDILVCGMTTPEYVPAMKKAAAIITDEGGITCHAAIISRELNIPCIVSTKIATSAFRDGDLVDVDANKGIIKIIKRVIKNE